MMWYLCVSAGECGSGTCIVHQLQLMDSVEQLTLQAYKFGGCSTSQCQHHRIWGGRRWCHSQYKSISECHLLPEFFCWQRRGQALCPCWSLVNWKFWSHQPSNLVVGQWCCDSWINGRSLTVNNNNMMWCRENGSLIWFNYNLPMLCKFVLWKSEVKVIFQHGHNVNKLYFPMLILIFFLVSLLILIFDQAMLVLTNYKEWMVYSDCSFSSYNFFLFWLTVKSEV